jgi:hypothetical protein
MKPVTVATLAVALSVFGPSHAEDSKAMAKPDSVSLFQVPLQCPAAPEIACGSRAKPILHALEEDPNISQAWVNRAGTMIAVVGSDSSSRESRATAVQSLLKEIFEKDVATEINGEARQKELPRFLSGQDWYRAAHTDNLSKEEWDIIARRLVGRMQAKLAVSAEQVKALEVGFAEVFKRRFLPQSSDLLTEQQRKERSVGGQNAIGERLADVARKYLDEAGADAVKEAFAKGSVPLPGEK